MITLEKYSGAPSYRVGLEIAESLVGSSTDSTLFDNAQGSSNENAAGADRLKIELTLAKHLIDSTTDSNFVELMRVNNGIMELSIQRPEYNAFENLLASRTFDTSGDFIVRQFIPTIKEHLDDGTNGGVYSTINGGLKDEFVVKTTAGKAYVRGYQIDKPVGSTIPLKKARSTASLTGASTPVRIGNFVKVKNAHGLPEFGNESGTDAQKPYGIVKLFDAVTVQRLELKTLVDKLVSQELETLIWQLQVLQTVPKYGIMLLFGIHICLISKCLPNLSTVHTVVLQ